MAKGSVERFPPTAGRASGAVALVLAAAVAVIGVVRVDEGFPPWGIAASFLFGVVTWAATLRPALWVEDGTLVMRNLLDTVHVPLAAVEELVVRQVLAVRAGGRRHVSTVVGRSRREIARLGIRGAESDEKAPAQLDYVDFVEQRLRALVADARAGQARVRAPDQQALANVVRRDPAWLPIGLVALACVGLAVSLLV